MILPNEGDKMKILVTGATKGIGKVIAENLDGEIFATGRNKEALKFYKNHFVADVAREDELIALGDYIEKNDIDILINNAGSCIWSDVEKMSYVDINKIISTNLTASLYLISRAVKNMKTKRFGRIINIGSISGVMGEAGASAYSASKSGLIGMSKSLALELAEYNITVNTINPGWVDTDLGVNSIDDSGFTKEEIIETIPQRRFVQPIEIANLIKYLISDEAKGLTGQSINLCAGLSVGY